MRLAFADAAAFTAGFARHVRADSIFLPTPKPKARGTLLRFELVDSAGRRLLLGEGRILRSVAPGAGRTPGMLIKLARLAGDSREVFAALVRVNERAAATEAWTPPAASAHANDPTPLPVVARAPKLRPTDSGLPPQRPPAGQRPEREGPSTPQPDAQRSAARSRSPLPPSRRSRLARLEAIERDIDHLLTGAPDTPPVQPRPSTDPLFPAVTGEGARSSTRDTQPTLSRSPGPSSAAPETRAGPSGRLPSAPALDVARDLRAALSAPPAGESTLGWREGPRSSETLRIPAPPGTPPPAAGAAWRSAPPSGLGLPSPPLPATRDEGGSLDDAPRPGGEVSAEFIADGAVWAALEQSGAGADPFDAVLADDEIPGPESEELAEPDGARAEAELALALARAHQPIGPPPRPPLPKPVDAAAEDEALAPRRLPSPEPAPPPRDPPRPPDDERRTVTPTAPAAGELAPRRSLLHRALLWLGLAAEERRGGPGAGVPPLPDLVPAIPDDGQDPMAADPNALGTALQELERAQAEALPLLPDDAVLRVADGPPR